MIFTREQQDALTADQHVLVDQYQALNEQANAIEPYDFTRTGELQALDERMVALQTRLEAEGLVMDEIGQWGPKS